MKCRDKFTHSKAIRKCIAIGSVTLILFFSFSFSIYAQETIPSTGGDAIGSGGSVSYTVGQIIYISSSGAIASIDQGIQHPYEISIVTGIDDLIGINLICTAYPNPVNDFLTLEVKNFQNENLFYQLYDMNGRILDSKRITNIQSIIPMENFYSATYFLKIFNNQKEVKIFKIIKR